MKNKQILNYLKLLKQSPICNDWQTWLNKYIHPYAVNISDFIQDKIDKNLTITKNDIIMVKYSGAMQFLIIAYTPTNKEILNQIENIINKIYNNNYHNIFLKENEVIENDQINRMS